MRVGEVSTFEVRAAEVGSFEMCIPKPCPFEVGGAEVGAFETRLA